MSTYVHNDTTYKTQMPINNRMDKMWYIHAIDEHFTTLHATIWISKTMLKAKHKRAHTIYVLIVYIAQKQAKITNGAGSQNSSYPGGGRQAVTRSKGASGYGGGDLGTSYGCLVSASSTYTPKNCTFQYVYFFEDDIEVTLLLETVLSGLMSELQQHLTSCDGSRRSRSHSGLGKASVFDDTLKLLLLETLNKVSSLHLLNQLSQSFLLFLAKTS